jgi:hypothetical protein
MLRFARPKADSGKAGATVSGVELAVETNRRVFHGDPKWEITGQHPVPSFSLSRRLM